MKFSLRSDKATATFIGVLALLASGCGGSADTVTTTPSTTETNETSTMTTGTVETATTVTTTGTGPYGLEGWEVVETVTGGYDLYGYSVDVWEVNAKAATYFPTNLGTDRRFYLLRPDVPAAKEIPLLMTLHGGAVDDDSASDYYTGATDPFQTKCGLPREVSAGFIVFRQMQIHEVMQRGWAMVVPENLWCDFWMGRGADDPVDPEHHKAHVHVTETLDFLKAGGGGFGISDLFFWGSSSGGSGVITASHWYDGVDGVISDSPPCNMRDYFPDDQASLKHIFGGPPADTNGVKSEFYQNYLDASCDWIITEDGYDVPIYVTHNVRDILTQSYNGDAITAAMDLALADAGVRYGHKDFDHSYPGSAAHTQSRGTDVIPRYTTRAMFGFLEGNGVVFVEAEDGCEASTCDVGRNADASTDSDNKLDRCSQGVCRVVVPADGDGVVYSGGLPDAVTDGMSISASLVFEISGTGSMSPTDDVLTISFVDTSGVVLSQNLTLADIVSDGYNIGPTDDDTFVTMQQHAKQFDASTLNVTVTDAASSRIVVDYTASGDKATKVYLDAVIYQIMP